MTQHEIVALQCPLCGGGSTQVSRELAFGGEFRCDHCGITSVLIIDRALVSLSTLQKQGEKVCAACGRIAQREARFCQEGHPLVRKCIRCRKEFAVDHQRCDACGWLQSVGLDTVEGRAIIYDEAIRHLADPAGENVGRGLQVIKDSSGTASTAAVAAAASAMHGVVMHLSVYPRISVDWEDRLCWEALGALGPAARQFVPVMLERLRAHGDPEGSDNEGFMMRLIGKISPEDFLAYCSRRLEAEGKNPSSGKTVALAFRLGKSAIPTLEGFCGPFSGKRGAICRAAISALREGKALVIVDGTTMVQGL